MKLPSLHIFSTLTQIVNIVTSRQRLKQFLTTPLYTNAVYLIASTAIMALFGFFFWIVVARFYTETDVGFGSAIISAINLLALISLVGLNFSIIRVLPQAEKPQELINTCFTLGSLISLVIAVVFIASLDFWSPALSFIKANAIFPSAFIVFTLLATLFYLIEYTFIAKRSASFVLFKNTILSILKIPLPILFVLFLHSFGIVASWGIALGIAVAVSLFLFLPKVQNTYKLVPTLKLNLIKEMWQYSGGNYLADLLTIAPTMVLPIMVVNLLGPMQSAYFYIGSMIAGLLHTIPLGVSQSLFAEGSHFEGKLRENAIKSFKFTFLLLVPAVILLILIGKWLLLVFGQSYSANALKLLWILSISSLPLGINHIYSSILRVTGRLKELIAIWGFIAITVLGTSYLIMPATGIVGIGYAWLGANTAAAIYVIIAGRQLQRR